jgi:hypothetical protein
MWGAADAQGPVPVPVPTATIGFTNKTPAKITIKGYTIVNSEQRPGNLLVLSKKGEKGDQGFDGNVPLGQRFYNVYDWNSGRILVKDFRVPIQRPGFAPLDIVVSPTNPNQITIVPPAPPGAPPFQPLP